ncbi:amino acid permease [Candidatus Parcubacteria bacterium]|nr:amino acid permease [Candidatus Parcubacteria bacterium]
MSDFLKALSVFIGTVIGVGIFGLPYVAYKTGFSIVLFYFLLMAGIAVLIHFLFAEICLATKGEHRFPGYVGRYFGSFWKRVTLLTGSIGICGSLLAYLIVGGEFLQFFFSPFFGGDSLLYTLIFFSLGAYFVFRGIKSISQIEFVLSLVLFAILALFSFRAVPFINTDYFSDTNWEFAALPYGVILFSLWGMSIIPEIKEMLKGKQRELKKVIATGTLLSVFIYLLFIIIVLGVSGPNTSKTGMGGFIDVVGNGTLVFGFLFGVITCFVPLGLFLIGFKEFIDIIGFVGALTIGIDGMIIIFLYRKFLRQKRSQTMNPLIYLAGLVFILGIGLEVFYFLWVK